MLPEPDLYSAATAVGATSAAPLPSQKVMMVLPALESITPVALTLMTSIAANGVMDCDNTVALAAAVGGVADGA